MKHSFSELVCFRCKVRQMTLPPEDGITIRRPGRAAIAYLWITEKRLIVSVWHKEDWDYAQHQVANGRQEKKL